LGGRSLVLCVSWRCPLEVSNVSPICRRAFCSARWAVPGAGLTSLGLPQWRGSPPSMGGRSPRLKIKARVASSRRQPPAVGDFLALFSLPPRRLCRGWLEYLGEVVASGRFWSHLSCGGRVWLAGGRVLAPSASLQLAVLMDVGLRRLHAPTGFCALGAVLVAASFCVGYLDGLPHGSGPWCW